MIKELHNAGSLPTLEVMMRFAGARQRTIAHNIANFSTPNFVPKDVSVNDFRAALGEAIDDRRARNGGVSGELNFGGTREVRPTRGGGLDFRPETHPGGVLAHDRTAHDLERTMQDLVENAGVYRAAAEFLRMQTQRLHAAIGERVT
ncbi:MAG: hypothetical protein DHS20C14_05440 [Phycisphaeraceae bacterium]|nr:MAG: hypothetical protein DHS20C14_05440 [Phycisphaeraceae bacterium]